MYLQLSWIAGEGNEAVSSSATLDRDDGTDVKARTAVAGQYLGSSSATQETCGRAVLHVCVTLPSLLFGCLERNGEV